MFGRQKLTVFQLRKQTLLLASDLNRLALRAECQRLREAANWTGRIANIRRAVEPWALVLAPLAGVVLALGIRRSSLGIGSLASALKVLPSLIQLWRTFVVPSNKTK